MCNIILIQQQLTKSYHIPMYYTIILKMRTLRLYIYNSLQHETVLIYSILQINLHNTKIYTENLLSFVGPYRPGYSGVVDGSAQVLPRTTKQATQQCSVQLWLSCLRTAQTTQIGTCTRSRRAQTEAAGVEGRVDDSVAAAARAVAGCEVVVQLWAVHAETYLLGYTNMQ